MIYRADGRKNHAMLSILPLRFNDILGIMGEMLQQKISKHIQEAVFFSLRWLTNLRTYCIALYFGSAIIGLALTDASRKNFHGSRTYIVYAISQENVLRS